MALLWELAHTPALLDAESREATRQATEEATILRERLSQERPVDAHREAQVKQWLANFSEQEEDFLRWLLDHSPANHHALTHSQFSDPARGETVAKGRNAGLIVDIGTRSGWAMQIQPNFVEALANVLHPQ